MNEDVANLSKEDFPELSSIPLDVNTSAPSYYYINVNNTDGNARFLKLRANGEISLYWRKDKLATPQYHDGSYITVQSDSTYIIDPSTSKGSISKIYFYVTYIFYSQLLEFSMEATFPTQLYPNHVFTPYDCPFCWYYFSVINASDAEVLSLGNSFLSVS